MATEVITKTTINRLRRRAKRGETREVRDLVQAGMSIRLTGRRLTWYCRFSTPAVGPDGQKGRTAHPICSVDACPDPVRMRQVVAAGRAALQDGRDPLAAIRTTLAHALQLPETRVAGTPSVSTWDFDTFRKEFKHDPPSWLRGPTTESYYKAMSRKQIGNLYEKRLVEITPQDIRDVRDCIRARGKNRQAALTVQALKTAFEWAGESKRSRYSGLTEDCNPAAEVVSKQRKRKRTKEDAIAAANQVTIDTEGNVVINDPKLPVMEDLGKLLLLLLNSTALPLLNRAVLLLLLFSVQRRLTVATALRKALLWVPQCNSALWVLDGGTTKGGVPHVLPFSHLAWQVIDSWSSSLPKAGDWLFPGQPTRAKPTPNGHIDVRTVNAWLSEACVLAGCSKHHSPHNIRLAFGTYLSQRGVSLAARKLILDHAEGRAGDVTEVHYNSDPKFKPKQQVIKEWNAFLEECLIRARKAHDLESRKTTSSFGPATIDIFAQPEHTKLPLPRQVLQPKAATPTLEGRVMPRATDPANLEKLRTRLGAREKIDDALARALRKRPLP